MSSIPDSGGNYNPATNGHANGAVIDRADLREKLKELVQASEVPALPMAAMQDVGSNRPPFDLLTLADLAKLPPKEWLIESIIGPGDIGMIYGAPGSGKTFVIIDMIIAACLGIDYAGQFHVQKPITVTYATGEGRGGLSQRFLAAAGHYGVKLDELPNFRAITDVPQLYNQSDQYNVVWFLEGYAAQIEAGEVERPDLLIIDTLHSATNGADENSSQHMGQVIHQLKTIAQRLGCAILVIHHSNRAGTGYRGSSALHGAMDTMIEVKNDKNPRTMYCAKLKDGQQWKPLSFTLKSQGESVYVEWGDAGESSTGESKVDGREQPKNAKGRHALGLLYQVKYEEDEHSLKHNENPGWLVSRDVALELGGKGLKEAALKALIEAYRGVLKRLLEKGYVTHAMLPKNSSSVQHWSISDTGKRLWETIQDDESIWV